MSFYDAIRVGASGASTGYEIDRSLRFDPNDTYMERTPSSAGNRKTFTISLWFKLGIVKEFTGSDGRVLFGSGGGGAGSSATNIGLVADVYGGPRLDFLSMLGAASGSNYIRLTTNAFIRDPSAWYHVVVKVDTPQGNSPNRAKMYINGEEVSEWYNYDQPDQNADTYLNVTDKHGIGASRVWSNQNNKYNYFGGYIAEFHFLDGTAYDASYFGETDSTTGQWIPKEYEGGNYGTNGFYLKFADNSGTTATTLGKDSSGNSNNYTPYGFSVAAGVGNDSLEDTPTNNFATLNILDLGGGASLANGNLDVSSSSAGGARSTFGMSSGKYYAECTFGNATGTVGITKGGTPISSFLGNSAGEYSYGQNGYKINGDNGSQTSYGDTFTSGDTIGIAFDADGGNLYFYKNGALQASGTAAFTGLTDGPYFFAFGNNVASSTCSYNFGQRTFANTIPTGYKVLNSANLPDPTILLPNKHFDILLYSGTGSSQNITGLEYQPDWVWIKSRSSTNFNNVYDTLRLFSDGTKERIYTNATNAGESSTYSGTTNLTAFNSDGFTVSNGDDTNGSGKTYVAWNWDAGETDSATYTVKVVSDSGNKYRFNDFGTSAVTLNLAEGGTYTFDGSDSSMSGHPFVIGTAANGSVYSTGVTYQLDGASVTYSAYTSGYSSATTRKLIITVPASAPQLYYWCSIHSGMGGAINTNTTLGSSNFDGTLQATVKANTTAGFSIVTWTGNGSSGATIGHGLGVAPKSAFVKNRSSSTNWPAVLFDLQTGGQLNTSQAFSNGNYNAYFAGQPSSSVLTLGSHNSTNANGDNYVAYVFSEVSSYNKFASYSGNGNANGKFVYTGFRPAWVLISNSNAGFDWVLQDSKRSPGNVANKKLNPNQSAAEQSNYDKIDILSNGFKPRVSDAGVNANGSVYYYWAFAESPFKNSRAR